MLAARRLLRQRAVEDHLAARGRSVEALFAFLHEPRLALVPPRFFYEGVRLEPGEDGVVRCRFRGEPAALVRVTDALFLDVARFAAAWPRLFAELVGRVGEDAAREMIAEPAILEPLAGDGDRLKALIVEHRIRAENLIVLGEDAALEPGTLAGEPRFALRFERGTLELAYAPEVFRAEVGALGAHELEAEVRWNGAAIALSTELGWDESELAELAVVLSMTIDASAAEVVQICEAVLPESLEEIAGDLLAATLLNLFGVAHRKLGELDAAIRILTRALPIAERADPKLEQQVAYNLGYAKLETTMEGRVRVGSTGSAELVSAHYDIDERHRATWRECLGLFERALSLDATDATAQAQVDQTKQLLASLDGGSAPRGRPSAKRATSSTSPARARPRGLEPTPWWVVGLVVLVGVLLAVAAHVARRGEEALAPPPPLVDPPRPPSARELADAARLAALDELDLAAPAPAGASCSIGIAPPREVPRGTVTAPQLGRATNGELYGTEYFDATIRNYAALYAPSVDVRPASREGIGPITGARAEGSAPLSFDPYALTLIVTAWRDPIPSEDGSSMAPGHVEGRLVVWSYPRERFVCAGEVQADSSSPLSIVSAPPNDYLAPADDPLNRARLDLIEQALRAGIPRLAELAPDTPQP